MMPKYQFKLGQRVVFTLTNDNMVKIEDLYTEDVIVVPKDMFWNAAIAIAQFEDDEKK